MITVVCSASARERVTDFLAGAGAGPAIALRVHDDAAAEP